MGITKSMPGASPFISITPITPAEGGIMELVNRVCCGLDVHKPWLTACLRRVDDDGTVKKTIREFDTTTKALWELSDWLSEHHCPVVAMESTGIYWKPVFHILSQTVEVIVANAHEISRRPGDKTDKRDAKWISELLAHGLIRPSFIPPPHISAMRDLARLRTTLVQTRSQAKNRVHKILEDANIKLSSVATNLFGKSCRKMIDALVAGERDPRILADMAMRTLRKKIPKLELALSGSFTEHHAVMIKICLDQIDLLDRQIDQVDEQTDTLMEPYEDIRFRMSTIPGVEQRAASLILSEIGLDMSRFGSSRRLAAWAGVCPGNNESGGKRKRQRTRKGDRWLRRVLVQCAWATRKTDSFLGSTFRRLQARIGGKKTAMAVAHKILVIIYHILSEGTVYDEDRYGHLNPRLEARLRQNAVRALERLGYKVALT